MVHRDFSAEYPLHLWSAGADWLLVPLLDHLAATRDPELLARIRPVLAELLPRCPAQHRSR
ncbi:MAG TPA: hypothetical protein VJ914_39690 [Pseudonocardiaceae bacterium]|nr:hypothetical protein [Pseudonocardiaceae bacterium]